jgi:integrase
MAKPLTEISIRRMVPGEHRREIPDGLLPGLYLSIEPSGSRSFVVRYRVASRTRKQTLGRWPAISLANARGLARDAILAVKQGRDPARERQTQRREAEANTLRAVCDMYFRLAGAKLRSAREQQTVLARLVIPNLGHRGIDTIRRRDVTALLDQVQTTSGPSMAEKVLQILRRIFNWHATRTDDFLSPIVRGMNRTKQKDRARSRILSDDEIQALWATAEADRGPFGPWLQFLMLTGARRSEALGMRRGEFAGNDWILPPERNKTGTELVRPLSPAALSVITRVPVIASGDIVFTANGRGAIGAISGRKAQVDKASGVTGWRIHDLRRTARSLMSRAGVQSDHAERCLGHVIGGVRGTYDRHEYYNEKAKAFEALAAVIETIIRGPVEKVVPLMNA